MVVGSHMPERAAVESDATHILGRAKVVWESMVKRDRKKKRRSYALLEILTFGQSYRAAITLKGILEAGILGGRSTFY